MISRYCKMFFTIFFKYFCACFCECFCACSYATIFYFQLPVQPFHPARDLFPSIACDITVTSAPHEPVGQSTRRSYFDCSACRDGAFNARAEAILATPRAGPAHLMHAAKLFGWIRVPGRSIWCTRQSYLVKFACRDGTLDARAEAIWANSRAGTAHLMHAAKLFWRIRVPGWRTFCTCRRYLLESAHSVCHHL